MPLQRLPVPIAGATFYSLDSRRNGGDYGIRERARLRAMVAWRSMNLTAPLLAAIAKLLSGATVRWHDCQPDTCQRVYFANHTSHLDALVLWSSLPGEIRDLTRPVAAKDYWSQGARAAATSPSCFNAILIDREEIKVHQSPVDLMIREIGTTHSLIVFPEGRPQHRTRRCRSSSRACIT